MSDSPVIILYDIPGTVAGHAWSPNTWKARFALNIKGIPYKTEWVEYPDVVDLCKRIGAAHTEIRGGSPHYTLPIIYDPSTKAVVSDSFKIAQYLDKTYPSLPALIPAGTEAFQAMFTNTIEQRIQNVMFPVLALATLLQLSPRSMEYFRRTREVRLGKKVEDFAPEGEVRDAIWKTSLGTFSEVHGWMGANGIGKTFVMGDTPSFADADIGSHLVWIKLVMGTESKEWKDILAADEGRWPRLAEALSKWEVVN